MLQRMCATLRGCSVPLMYIEGTMFPSIFLCSAKDNCSIASAIPASLLNAQFQRFGFAAMANHVRNRLTTPFSGISSDL
eukprot:800599-Ditylum_brightwellii.AAC.1